MDPEEFARYAWDILLIVVRHATRLHGLVCRSSSCIMKLHGILKRSYESTVRHAAAICLACFTRKGASASWGIRHTPVAWVLNVLDDLAQHAILALKRLDLLRKLRNLQSNPVVTALSHWHVTHRWHEEGPASSREYHPSCAHLHNWDDQPLAKAQSTSL